MRGTRWNVHRQAGCNERSCDLRGRARRETGGGQPVEWHVLFRESEHVFYSIIPQIWSECARLWSSWGKLEKF